jgi:autotransporter-associated beta strand protein
MKPQFTNKFLGSITAALLTLFVTPAAQAAALTWSGGSGNWQDGIAGGWSAAWNSATPDSGSFTGAGGTVTLLGPITTLSGTAPTTFGLNFAGTGDYTISAASAQTLTVGTGTTNAVVRVAAGRTAIIGANVTLQRSTGAGGWYINNGGTLEIASGGAFTQGTTGGTEVAGGSTLRINGGTATLGGSLSIGALTAPGGGANGHLLVDSGSLTIGGTGNLAIGRVNGETTTGTINNGSITVSAGNLNFGTGATSPTATFNLNGGTLTVKAVTSTNATNSTFNFNGGTLKAAASAAATFMTNIDTARIRNGAAIIDSNGAAITFSQVLAHSNLGGDNAIDGGLTLNDSAVTKGTLTLASANTYTGATKITAGTLNLTNSLALQNSALDTLNSATGDASNGLKTNVAALTFGGLTGNKNLADVFTTASGGYSGVTALTLNTGSGVTHTYSGDIANGAMTLTKTGAGAQIFTGGNTHTGLTTISTGALIAAANNALGTNAAGTTVASGTSLGLSGGIDYTTTEAVSGSGVGSGVISGTLAAISRGFIQSVSGNNTFRGDITVSAGGVTRIGTQNGASLTLTGTITQASGTMYFRPGDNGGEFVTLSGSGNSFGGNSVIYTNATTNYSGVRLGVDNALPTTLTISGETGTGAGTALDLNGKIQKLNGLTGAQTLNIINSNTSTAATITLENLVDRSTTGTLLRGGVGLGTVNVIKDGAFTQTLSGTHDYTGTTNVNQGTLLINGNISTSTLTAVASGATLGGSGTVGKTVVNGTLAVGNSPGTMTFTDTLGLAGTTLTEIDGTSGAGVAGGHDFVNLTGAGAAGVLTYGGTMTLDIGVLFVVGTYSWNLFDMASEAGTFATITLADQYSGSLLDADLDGVWDLTSGSDTWQFTESTGVLGLTVVPEPNVAALFGGLGLLALLHRRRS